MTKKRIILIIVIAVALLLAGTAYSFRFQIGEFIAGLTAQQSQPQVVEELGQEKLDSTLESVRQKTASGDTVAAQKELDDAIGQTKSSKEKSALYLQKAAINTQTGDKAAAIAAAEAAAENDPSRYSNYDVLATMYEENGEYAKAIEAYQKAIEAYQSNPPKDGGQTGPEYYEMKIRELQAKL